MNIEEKTKLETAFEEFNSLMDSYNQEYTSATTQEESDAVEAKYKVLIERQETSLEASVEEDFQDSLDKAALEESQILIDIEAQTEVEEVEEVEFTDAKSIRDLTEDELDKLILDYSIELNEGLAFKNKQNKVVQYFRKNIWK